MAVLDGVRSYLFVPASDPRRVDKALASAAHAVVLDLEDAVAPEAKEEARAVVAEKLRTRRANGIQLVRTNGLETPHGRPDFAALDGLAVDAIMIPKAEPQPLLALGPSGPPVIALIETARGLRRAHEVATRIPRVVALMLGNVDLAAELGATPGPDGRELLFARSALVVDSIAAGLGGPIDGPCTAIDDDDALRTEARRGEGARLRGEGVHPPAPARRRPRRLHADRRGARVGAARRRRGRRGEGPRRDRGRRADGRRAGRRASAPPARELTARSTPPPPRQSAGRRRGMSGPWPRR